MTGDDDDDDDYSLLKSRDIRESLLVLFGEGCARPPAPFRYYPPFIFLFYFLFFIYYIIYNII